MANSPEEPNQDFYSALVRAGGNELPDGGLGAAELDPGNYGRGRKLGGQIKGIGGKVVTAFNSFGNSATVHLILDPEHGTAISDFYRPKQEPRENLSDLFNA